MHTRGNKTELELESDAIRNKLGQWVIYSPKCNLLFFINQYLYVVLWNPLDVLPHHISDLTVLHVPSPFIYCNDVIAEQEYPQEFLHAGWLVAGLLLRDSWLNSLTPYILLLKLHPVSHLWTTFYWTHIVLSCFSSVLHHTVLFKECLNITHCIHF